MAKLKLKTIRNTAVGALLLILGIGIGYNLALSPSAIPFRNRLAQAQIVNTQPPASTSDVDFALFWETWNRLESTYVDPEKLDRQKMVYGAIKGMTESIGDPYTVFLPPQENKEAKSDLKGEFEGVGIQLGYEEGQLAVMSPLEGMPAIKQGVRAGDLILNIKDEAKGIDQDTQGMNLIDAVELIRGKKGTPVTLTLFRESKGKFDVTIKRDTIVVPSVELKTGDWVNGNWQESPTGQVAWLRVYRFGDRTEEEWNKSVRQIVAQKPQLKGVVLDLRNNPGGYLQSAIDLASEFIPEGVVVKQQGRNSSETYSVSKKGQLIGVPTVVLINKGSASASEILAGALRDRLGVKLVGDKSFGKGTVQDALDVRNQAGLHVTIAKWLLPNGEWIHEEGLKPDVEVALEEPKQDESTPKDTLREDEIIDNQLQKAIEVLKAS